MTDRSQSAPLSRLITAAAALAEYVRPNNMKHITECNLIEALDAYRSASVSETRAHSKSEYRRVTAQGGEILPPVATPPNTTDAYKEAVAANLKLRKALEQCVSVTRTWHAMPQKPGDDDAFDLYFNHSPEMKLIRDALGKMPDPMDEQTEREQSQ